MSKYIKDEGTLNTYQVNFFYLGAFIFFFLFIVFGHFPAFSGERWYSGLDINKDGTYSISDFIKWLLWIFFMPGDVLIQGLMTFDFTARFFEVSQSSYSKIGSMIFSFVYWWMVGNRKMTVFWAVILFLIMLNNLPGIPFLH